MRFVCGNADIKDSRNNIVIMVVFFIVEYFVLVNIRINV